MRHVGPILGFNEMLLWTTKLCRLTKPGNIAPYLDLMAWDPKLRFGIQGLRSSQGPGRNSDRLSLG